MMVLNSNWFSEMGNDARQWIACLDNAIVLPDYLLVTLTVRATYRLLHGYGGSMSRHLIPTQVVYSGQHLMQINIACGWRNIDLPN